MYNEKQIEIEKDLNKLISIMICLKYKKEITEDHKKVLRKYVEVD